VILFIDDEPFYVGSYIDELRDSGYEVKIETTVDNGADCFRNNTGQIELVIIDVMMPAGKTFKRVDKSLGLRTGFLLYDWLRDLDKDIPIVILSNTDHQEVKEKFANETNWWFFRKDECFPFELVEAIKEILSRGRQQAG